MDIKKAKQLKYGDVVHCPGDRGDYPYTGKVEIQPDLSKAPVYKTPNGTEYIWVLVKGFGKTIVWPSNRLS